MYTSVKIIKRITLCVLSTAVFSLVVIIAQGIIERNNIEPFSPLRALTYILAMLLGLLTMFALYFSLDALVSNKTQVLVLIIVICIAALIAGSILASQNKQIGFILLSIFVPILLFICFFHLIEHVLKALLIVGVIMMLFSGGLFGLRGFGLIDIIAISYAIPMMGSGALLVLVYIFMRHGESESQTIENRALRTEM